VELTIKRVSSPILPVFSPDKDERAVRPGAAARSDPATSFLKQKKPIGPLTRTARHPRTRVDRKRQHCETNETRTPRGGKTAETPTV